MLCLVLDLDYLDVVLLEELSEFFCEVLVAGVEELDATEAVGLGWTFGLGFEGGSEVYFGTVDVAEALLFVDDT